MGSRCRVRLMPTPSSRAAEQSPDRETFMTFERTPVSGDAIELGEGWHSDFVGRVYMVRTVAFRVPNDDPDGRSNVLVTALRLL